MGVARPSYLTKAVDIDALRTVCAVAAHHITADQAECRLGHGFTRCWARGRLHTSDQFPVLPRERREGTHRWRWGERGSPCSCSVVFGCTLVHFVEQWTEPVGYETFNTNVAVWCGTVGFKRRQLKRCHNIVDVKRQSEPTRSVQHGSLHQRNSHNGGLHRIDNIVRKLLAYSKPKQMREHAVQSTVGDQNPSTGRGVSVHWTGLERTLKQGEHSTQPPQCLYVGITATGSYQASTCRKQQRGVDRSDELIITAVHKHGFSTDNIGSEALAEHCCHLRSAKQCMGPHESNEYAGHRL
mmetsp:Transcript_20156/g.52304  ORF Transcript_20156/g.52304 Transcript_20156/m.52304 type:complete len:297 (+) Transcript_20156:313-1203(+)